MRESDASEFWCPMGRISLQKGSSQPKIDVVPGGAFNVALTFAPNSAAHGAARYPSVCIGKKCALWKRGLFGRYGHCGLISSSPLWPLYLFAALALAAYFLKSGLNLFFAGA